MPKTFIPRLPDVDMRTAVVLLLTAAVLYGHASTRLAAQAAASGARANGRAVTAQQHARARMQGDVAALQMYRPEFPFWRHIFTVPDGAVIFGSGVDGQLIATFPTEGDWQRDGVWEDPSLETL